MVSRNGLCGEIGIHAFVVGMSSFKIFRSLFEEMCADDLLYLCACDRQGTIRSGGISIIADFPRFLVCHLLSFHHISVNECSVSCHANISCEKHPTSGHTKPLSPPVEETAHDEMAHTVKIINHKIQRPLEINPPETHCAIFGKYVPSSSNDLPSSPSLHVSLDLQARNTLREQSTPGIWGKRNRILRVVMSEELAPLTSQTGKSFVDAWLNTVTCTLFSGLIAVSD